MYIRCFKSALYLCVVTVLILCIESFDPIQYDENLGNDFFYQTTSLACDTQESIMVVPSADFSIPVVVGIVDSALPLVETVLGDTTNFGYFYIQVTSLAPLSPDQTIKCIYHIILFAGLETGLLYASCGQYGFLCNRERIHCAELEQTQDGQHYSWNSIS